VNFDTRSNEADQFQRHLPSLFRHRRFDEPIPLPGRRQALAGHNALVCDLCNNDKGRPVLPDECVPKLAALIELWDNRNLGEIAELTARLAVPVE
jgi:hypothetical protein